MTSTCPETLPSIKCKRCGVSISPPTVDALEAHEAECAAAGKRFRSRSERRGPSRAAANRRRAAHRRARGAVQRAAAAEQPRRAAQRGRGAASGGGGATRAVRRRVLHDPLRRRAALTVLARARREARARVRSRAAA